MFRSPFEGDLRLISAITAKLVAPGERRAEPTGGRHRTGFVEQRFERPLIGSGRLPMASEDLVEVRRRHTGSVSLVPGQRPLPRTGVSIVSSGRPARMPPNAFMICFMTSLVL